MKKCLVIIFFIVIIFINSQCYAVDISDINSTYLSTLTDDEFREVIPIINNYNAQFVLPYFILYKEGSNYYFTYSLTPLIVRNYTYYNGTFLVGSFEGVGNNEFLNMTENYCRYYKVRVNNNSTPFYLSANRQQQDYTVQTSSIQIDTIDNVNILYSNHDIVNVENNDVYFAKNIDFNTSSDNEGDIIDMTETNNILNTNFGLIKGFLFLICMYLLCKAIYGCIWWLYNKTLL